MASELKKMFGPLKPGLGVGVAAMVAFVIIGSIAGDQLTPLNPPPIVAAIYFTVAILSSAFLAGYIAKNEGLTAGLQLALLFVIPISGQAISSLRIGMRARGVLVEWLTLVGIIFTFGPLGGWLGGRFSNKRQRPT